MLTIALSHLQGRGVRLEPHEAVALARELLAHPCGIPTPENIQLASDGSASCSGSEGTLSVASVANLLQKLLPPGTPNVPAPLRYTIARGLEDVEAPPFESLNEFSTVLARFERGASRDVLRDVLQRGASFTPAPPRPALVVRKPERPSSELRRPIAAGPPMFLAFGGDEKVSSPAHSLRWWATVAAASFVASFVVGFAVMERIVDQRWAIRSAHSTLAPTVAVAGSVAAADAVANTAEVEVRNEIVHAPLKPVGEPVSAIGEHVSAIEAVRATNANAFSPAFASDGTAIFFHTGSDRDARSAIEVATAGTQTGKDLTIMTIVDDGSHNYHVQPSPDGRFVAFDSDRGGERAIYVANRDGSQVRRVSGPGYSAVPTWSPNGEWLAYIRAEADKPSVWNVWVQPAAGGTPRRLTNHRYGQTWAASWFPDNRRIAYSHEDTLIVTDLQSGEATRYQTPVKGQLVRTPAVSPDGSKIIFQVFRRGAWLLNLADGSMQRVLTDPTAEEFAWSPDGNRIAFHSRRDGQWGIYVLWRS